MKLLRPLHRQRRRRRNRTTILANAELAVHFQVDEAELERHLSERNIPFHKDGRGAIWASVETC